MHTVPLHAGDHVTRRVSAMNYIRTCEFLLCLLHTVSTVLSFRKGGVSTLTFFVYRMYGYTCVVAYSNNTRTCQWVLKTVHVTYCDIY